MIINDKNQNDIVGSELIKSYNIEYNFSNKPIKRIKNKPVIENKSELLNNLKERIKKIEDCDLKKNANQIVFNDGNPFSPLMIIGEGPGQKEDEMGKPFVGDAGILLNRMLKAININRNEVYITNVVNYRPPNNRKPENSEITRYSNYLREHISIIDPKILVLMGSTAMETMFGSKIKISKERGKWKEVIVNQKTYLTMITFHPAYLLRQVDQKKYSWYDLKEIKKKINQLNLKL